MTRLCEPEREWVIVENGVPRTSSRSEVALILAQSRRCERLGDTG
jgi:hypothetical protein